MCGCDVDLPHHLSLCYKIAAGEVYIDSRSGAKGDILVTMVMVIVVVC